MGTTRRRGIWRRTSDTEIGPERPYAHVLPEAANAYLARRGDVLRPRSR